MDYFEQIDDYILEKLPALEKRAFTQALGKDLELQKEVEFRKELLRGMAQVETEVIKHRLQAAISAAGIQAEPAFAPRKLKQKWWAVAASILLLCSIGIWGLWPKASFDQEATFQQYFQPKPYFNQERTPNISQTHSLTDSLQNWYQQQQYTKIINRLTRLPNASKNLDQTYLEAIVLIKTQQNEAAHQALESLIYNSGIRYTAEAKWVKSLLYLREGSFSAARKLLLDLKQNHTSHHKKEVQELLDIL
ncbi:MAG TPA: hypothetical protein ENJ82_12480 [Bacteroidetes bacterium]|nr:hypothetical protein [Bacteroidota bacterium]